MGEKDEKGVDELPISKGALKTFKFIARGQ